MTRTCPERTPNPPGTPSPPGTQPAARRWRGRAALLAAVCLALPPTAASAGLETPTDGGSTTAWYWEQGPLVTVQDSPDGSIVGNSNVSAVDMVDAAGMPQRKVFYSWIKNNDDPAEPAVTRLKRSYNSGQTYTADPRVYNTSFHAMTKLRDGSLYDVAFVPPIGGITPDYVTLNVRRSFDNGENWGNQLTARFTTGDPALKIQGFRANAGILQDGDGNLYLSYYTKYAVDSGRRSEVAISRDNGASWQRYGTVFMPVPGYEHTETALSWTPTGEMVAVAVRDTIAAQGQPRKHVALYTARSATGNVAGKQVGEVWTGQKLLPLEFSPGYAFRPDDAGVIRYGVTPTLQLLPNGAMTLRFGRPDNWFAISPDGSGHKFVQARRTYVNYPSNGSNYHGSSGNGSHTVVGPDKVLVSGDNCAPTWGCPAGDSGWTIDNKYRVWQKVITVRRPGVGKIDLLGKVRAGTATIDTNMTQADPDLPEMGVRGAIDGSTDWASSAVRPAGSTGPSTYTINFNREYIFTEVGLSLRPGKASSATVEALVDGQWVSVALDIGGFVGIRSHSLSYRKVSGAGVAATAVRVTVNDPNPDATGAAFLNEIELYSTADSFETETVGQVPRGYTDSIGAAVTNVGADDSRHVVKLVDNWADRIGQLHWNTPAASRQNLEFRVKSLRSPQAFLFTTKGTTAAGAAATAFHMGVLGDGSLAWYRPSTGWVTFAGAPANSVPVNTWHTIRVEASLSAAQVYLDGRLVGTASPHTSVTAITGYNFATTGTVPTGDQFLIDDVARTT